MRLFSRLFLFVLVYSGFEISTFAQSTVPTLVTTLPNQTLKLNAPPLTLDLTSYFSIPSVTGPIVQFNTILGSYNAELYTSAAPINAANFLSYVNAGSYTNSFIDRSVPGFVVQGGSYDIVSGSIAAIPTSAPVVLEYNLPNALGTLAAARTSVLNSATSAWYINTVDNSTNLGPTNAGGYTVFGRILGTGMTVVNAIASLPVYNVNSGQFPNLPVYNYNSTSGSLTTSNLVMVNSITQIPMFPTPTAKTAVLTWNISSSNPATALATLSGSTLNLSALSAGTSLITVTASDTNGNVAQGSFTVTTSPTITSQPVSQTITAGSSVVFTTAIISSAGASYQWNFNGTAIAGATSSTYLIQAAGSSKAGNYTCTITNAAGSTTTSLASLSVITSQNPGRLVNLSVLTMDGPGSQLLTIGFVSGGAATLGSEQLLIRATGPALTNFSVANVLADPMLTLYQGSNVIASNDNWGSTATNIAAVNAADAATGAFTLPSSTSLDAALVQTLPSGGYTIQVAGKGAQVGNALAEVYDNTLSYTASSPRLVNLSCMQQVAANGLLTAGFAISGTTSKTVLIRASGPTLTTFGVQNVMPDPQINVFNSNTTVIASNAGWAGDTSITTAQTAVGAFAFTSTTSKDSAVLITLAPGSYSAQATSASGAAGTTLIEVYEVQ
ncbi:MAG: peptidylprolyl isomerase [Verrucomicrobiota bacterium]